MDRRLPPNRISALRWGLAIGLAALSVIVVLGIVQTPQHIQAQTLRTNQSLTPRSSFLFRFDPASQTFFTIPLPFGSVPVGVAVTGTHPTHVWVTEYGLNRIGHLIFTDTAHYQLINYSITSTVTSGPFRIAVDGNSVWFTERGANRVGRINALTGQIDEFYGHGLSSNSGLSDIKVAPDGAVWIGGQSARRLIQLNVNSPSDYSFNEYTDTARPSFIVAPYLLAVENSNSIWMTVPEANFYKIAQFTPASQYFVWPTLPAGSSPIGIAITPGQAWFGDISRNRISQIVIGTLTIANSFGPIARPAEIAAESDNIFWVTQFDGAIGRLIYTSTVSSQIDSFALPVPDLQLTGIAVAPDHGVWSGAYVPERIFLPHVSKNN